MEQKKEPTALTSKQKLMLSRRGLDPQYFEVVKDTYASLYVRDKRSGMVKIIYKNN